MKELGADEGGSSPPMDDEDLMLRAGGAGDDADNEDADLSLVCSRNVRDLALPRVRYCVTHCRRAF